jgi:hypothetical protein
MANFYAFYPPVGGGSTNPSVGVNGAIAPTSSTEVAGINPSGNLQPLQTDASGNLLVSDAAATGAGGTVTFTATGQSYAFMTDGASTVSFVPTGTWTGLIGIVGSSDGVNFSTIPLPLYDIDIEATVDYATTNLPYVCQIGGFKTIIIRSFGTWTGTAVVAVWLNSGINAVTVTSSTAAGLLATVNVQDGAGNPISSTSGSLNVDVTNASLPLPTGAATAANQVTQENTLTAIQANQTNGTQETSIVGSLPAGTNAIGSVSVSNFPATQPVSGTVTVVQPTGSNLHVDVDSSALPAGASTSALQTTGNTSLSSILANQTNGTQETSIVGTVPLPTGAATAANQTAVIGAGGLGGTAATNSELVGGYYAGGPLALTVGQQAPIQLDVAGNTKISGTVTAVQGTVPWQENISQFAGNPAQTGTGTSGLGVPRVTVSSDSSITANAGTNLNTSALALNTTVAALQVGQGSTTSGQNGDLVQGAVTTAAPTYTTAQTSPLSLTTSGALRIDGTVRPTQGTLTDNSGTTSATPSTSTTIMASNATRKYLLIQNVSTVNTIWINFTSAATATEPSYQLLPGGSIVQEASFISTEAITVLCTVASSPYTAKQA